MSKSEVKIRCYEPSDSLRCHTMFAEGMKELLMPVVKIVYPDYLKVAVILLVPIIGVAVRFSIWNILILYLAACAVMAAILYIYIYLKIMEFISGCLQSDLLDIEKYYSGDSCMFVAECGGRVIGMVGVAKKEYHKPGVAELQRMSVCSSARGKGIGKLLVNKVVEYCKEKNYDKIFLVTTSAQHGAAALYTKCGFDLVKGYCVPYPYVLYSVKDYAYEKSI